MNSLGTRTLNVYDEAAGKLKYTVVKRLESTNDIDWENDTVTELEDGYTEHEGYVVNYNKTYIHSDSARTEITSTMSTRDGKKSWQTDKGQTTFTEQSYMGYGKTVETIVKYDSTILTNEYLNGNLMLSSNSVLGETEFMYDEFNRLLGQDHEENGVMVSVRRTLNPQGQPLNVTQSAGGSSRTVAYTYDALGRKTTETSPEGIVMAYAYTSQGQVSGIHGGVYQQEYYYDDRGQLVHLVTYQNENTPQGTTFTYDNGGRLTEKTYADNTHEYYSYHGDGKIHEYTNCRGHVHTFSYGLAGELTGIYSDAGLNRSYEYNQLGQVTNITDNLGEFELQYDAYGNLISEIFPDGTSVGRNYDELQRLSGINLDDTALASFGYGTDGRIQSISNGSSEMTYSYLPGTNLIAGREWRAGESDPFLIVNKQYDHFARLIGITANNQPQIAYTLNKDDQRMTAEITDNTKWLYSYDNLKQLTGAARKDEAESLINTMSYTYDMIGNRIEANEDSEEKVYDTNLLNQYMQINNELCTYDADGNMQNNNGWQYIWSTENRLIKAEKDNIRLEFDYDYMGRRAFKKVYENDILIKHEKCVYFEYKLIAVYDALNNNALLKTFIWQPDNIDLDIPVCISENNNLYYYVADGNKNITGLFDNQGNQMASYTYSPFGKVLGSSGILAQVNPFRFSSEFHDDETELIYYNYRYYDPILGRWTKYDGLTEKSSLNLYAFLNNNTLNNWDVLGNMVFREPGSCVCGVNITEQMTKLLNHIDTVAKDPDSMKKLEEANANDPFSGWDIAELFDAGHKNRKDDFKGKSCGRGIVCQHTVTLWGGCYKVWAVNYIFWGKLHKILNRSLYLATRKVYLWRKATGVSSDENEPKWLGLESRLLFTRVGYEITSDTIMNPRNLANYEEKCDLCEEKYEGMLKARIKFKDGFYQIDTKDTKLKLM